MPSGSSADRSGRSGGTEPSGRARGAAPTARPRTRGASQPRRRADAVAVPAAVGAGDARLHEAPGPTVTWSVATDVRAFLAAAGTFLEADPVANTVLLTEAAYL